MLSDLIREQRNKLGYSQTHLAIRVGTTQGKISEWERGTVPSTHNLVKLSLALDLTMIQIAAELELD